MAEYQDEAPTGDVQDNDYVSRTGQSHIPVTKDSAPVEDPIDPNTADTDAQLGEQSLIDLLRNTLFITLSITYWAFC